MMAIVQELTVLFTLRTPFFKFERSENHLNIRNFKILTHLGFPIFPVNPKFEILDFVGIQIHKVVKNINKRVLLSKDSAQFYSEKDNFMYVRINCFKSLLKNIFTSQIFLFSTVNNKKKNEKKNERNSLTL